MTQKFTTAGALLIKHSLPTEEAKQHFNAYRKLDKSGVTGLVNTLLKYGGELAPEHINTLAKKFFNTATEIGATTPLSDYVNDSADRQALIDEFDFKIQKALAGKGPQAEKERELIGIV